MPFCNKSLSLTSSQNRDYKYPMGFIYWPVPDAYPYGLTARQMQTLFTMYRIDGILRFALMEALDYTFFPLWGISLLSFAHYTLIAGVHRRIGPLLISGPSIIRLLLWLTVLGSVFDSIENTITLQAATHYEKLIKSTPLKIRNLACNAKFVCLGATLIVLFLLIHLAARVQWQQWKQRRTRKSPELIA